MQEGFWYAPFFLEGTALVVEKQKVGHDAEQRVGYQRYKLPCGGHERKAKRWQDARRNEYGQLQWQILDTSGPAGSTLRALLDRGSVRHALLLATKRTLIEGRAALDSGMFRTLTAFSIHARNKE
nr:hypothetical protein [Pseudomonas matsuisoli]